MEDDGFRGIWVMMPVKVLCKECKNCQNLRIVDEGTILSADFETVATEHVLYCENLQGCLLVRRKVRQDDW